MLEWIWSDFHGHLFTQHISASGQENDEDGRVGTDNKKVLACYLGAFTGICLSLS